MCKKKQQREARDIVTALEDESRVMAMHPTGYLMKKAAVEIERLRLTRQEREALRRMLRRGRETFFANGSLSLVQDCSVIDGLLERLG